MARKIFDDQRDEILTRVLAFREPTKDISGALNISCSVITRTVATFRAVQDMDWKELVRLFGTSTPGITTLDWAARRARVKIPADVFDECKRLADEKTGAATRARNAQETEKPEPAKPEPKPEPPKVAAPETAPTGPKIHIPAASAETGWQTRIKVQPDKVCMMVYFNGMEVVQGWSKVKGDKELDLMQSISYAAHMCYKIVEQKKLGGR